MDAPSDLGPWSYEVTDAKLAREAKGGALLQLCVYSELLERMQGKAPEYAHLALGGPAPATPSESLAPTRNRAPNRDLPPRQLHGLEQTDSVTAGRSVSVRELTRY